VDTHKPFGRSRNALLLDSANAGRCAAKSIAFSVPDFYENKDLGMQGGSVGHDQINFTEPAVEVAGNNL
jgi:hypothetical protein